MWFKSLPDIHVRVVILRSYHNSLYTKSLASWKSRRSSLVAEGFGRISKRVDGRYFLYLPNDLVEDSGFPFPVKSSVRVKVHFKPGEKKLTVEEC